MTTIAIPSPASTLTRIWGVHAIIPPLVSVAMTTTKTARAASVDAASGHLFAGTADASPPKRHSIPSPSNKGNSSRFVKICGAINAEKMPPADPPIDIHR